MSTILPNLFLGSLRDAKNTYTKYNHIISILDVENKLILPVNCHTTYYLTDDVNSSLTPIIYKVAEHLENILQQNETVLVHCHAGVSRSAAVIIGYLMIKQYMSFNDAYIYVKMRRHIVCPNQGFLRQLRAICPENKEKV